MTTFIFWDIEQYVYCNYLFPCLWRHKFWNRPQLSYEAVLLHDQKSQGKNVNILAFFIVLKAFFIVFKVFLLKQLKPTFKKS